MKTSKVTQILKTNPKLKSFIYRPISLLLSLDKIFERIMFNRLYKFIEENNLIYNLQFEFREKHSTLNALIHLAEKIR